MIIPRLPFVPISLSIALCSFSWAAKPWHIDTSQEWKWAEEKSEGLAYENGFGLPLKTTPFPNQYDAPGGLKESLGGYHAWQSRDMVNWVHHGPVTEGFSRWVTTAEYANGQVYLYYDYPNDQDPHLYIDADLTDGMPGKNIGIAFKDPSDGSDCGVIRDPQGIFHLIADRRLDGLAGG